MSTPVRLSALDTAFVYGESQRIPLHVGGLTFIEAKPLRDESGAIDIERIRREMRKRLHLIPRFRQRLVEIPLDQGRPVWIDDVRFRIENHVHLTGLPRPGTREQLLAIMSRLQSIVMDRTRPLWEVWYVDGLENPNVIAIITKIHHCMIDGTSGIELGTLLYDFTREGTPMEEVPWRPALPPSALGLVAHAFRERLRDTWDFAREVAGAILHPSEPIEHVLNFVRALDVFASPVEKLPFNARVSSRRQFDTVRLNLNEVLATRAALGVKVNDVVLAAVAGALRQYCKRRNINPDRLQRIKAVVPVNSRSSGDKELGNKVSSLFVELPLSEPDPRKRLEQVAARTRELKESKLADATNLWNRVTSLLPPPLFRPVARLQFRGLMNQSNLMVSNVRGPNMPFYSFGAEVLEFYPYFGVHDYIGLNIVVVSYNGKLLIGIASDPELMPDLALFTRALPEAFAELYALNGVRQSPQKAQSTHATVRKKSRKAAVRRSNTLSATEPPRLTLVSGGS